jgi:hypothetical protein
MSVGRRSCALARFQILCVSLCAPRHSVQRQPVCQPADVPWPALVTPRTLAGPYRPPWPDLVSAGLRFWSQPPWLDLVLSHGQGFGNQRRFCPRDRSCPMADRVITQLEPLTSDLNELPAVVGSEPANVIEAARKHFVVEIEAAANHLVWRQHQFIVIDDLPLAVALDAQRQMNCRIRHGA